MTLQYHGVTYKQDRGDTMKKRAPSREGMTVTSVAFEPDVHRRLALAALEDNAALTELVRQAVKEWLDRRDARRTGRAKR